MIRSAGNTAPGKRKMTDGDRRAKMVTEIRNRIGAMPKEHALAAFFDRVPPSKSLSRYRNEVLQAAGRGYTALQIAGYLQAIHGVSVCDRTVRKFVGEQFQQALAGGKGSTMNFAAKANFALAEHPPTITENAEAAPPMRAREPKRGIAITEILSPSVPRSASIDHSGTTLDSATPSMDEARTIIAAEIAKADQRDRTVPEIKRLLGRNKPTAGQG
jgi:hypothetical protein